MRERVEERFSLPMADADDSLHRARIIAKHLPRQGDLLEIGVWEGRSLAHYRTRFLGRLYGLDISLQVMQRALPALTEAKACDLSSEPIPWPDERFDCVVCCEVIEHLFDTDRLVQEVRRVLKPGGLAAFSTPNLASSLNRVLVGVGLQPLGSEVSARRSNYGNPFRRPLRPAGHIRHFTPRALRELINDNGLTVMATEAAPLSGSPWIRAFERLSAATSPDLGSDLIVLARRT